MDNNSITEEYICEDCGTTTPVQNESCPSCGGKLLSADTMREPTATELAEEEDLSEEFGDKPTALKEDGSESLEALREEELDGDRQSYNEDSYDDE